MRISILVAESDPDFSDIVIEAFSSSEYSVRAVSSLDDAVKELASELPDVFVLSEELSGDKGQEICRTLRKKRGQVEAPAVILLTHEAKPHQIVAVNSWADACLRRPVDPVILESTVESVIQRRRKQAPANPLTKLPGPGALSKEIERRTAAGEDFATRTLRLTAANASAYKRKYGELKFLTMVRLAAHTIAGCALVHGGKEAFVAHRGTSEEPEFVVLIEAKKAAGFERAACEEFEASSEFLYDKRDRTENELVETDGAGKRVSTPFVSLIVEAMTEEKVGHR